MDPESGQGVLQPLRLESIQGSINSSKEAGVINLAVLRTKLEKKGAPANQIDYALGVFEQISNEKLLEQENAKPEELKNFEKIRHLTLALAARLNLMVAYLADQSPNRRFDNLRLADSIANTENYSGKWKHIRRGLVSSTGFYLYYRGKYGEKVSLPTAEQDVNQSIDLIIDDTYIQLKAKKAAKEPIMFNSSQSLNEHTETIIQGMDPTNPESQREILRLRKDLKGFERLEEMALNQGKKAVFLIASTSTFDSDNAELTGNYELPDII